MAFKAGEPSSHFSQHFIVMHGDQTLRDALVQLKAQNGQDWWYLVVDIGARFRFLAVQFNALREVIDRGGSGILQAALKDVGEPLLPVHFVDHGTDPAYAHKLALENPNGLVVVVEVTSKQRQTPTGSLSPLEVIGVLSVTGARSNGPESASLFDVTSQEFETTPGFDSESIIQSEDLLGTWQDSISEYPSHRRSGLLSRPEARENPITNEGSAAGDVVVAGNDVPVANQSSGSAGTRPYRFEAAFPHEVHLGQEYRLWVTALKPDQPSPFSLESAARLFEEDLDAPADAALSHSSQPGHRGPVVDILVTGNGIEVVDQAVKQLTIWPDDRIGKQWFLVQAAELGTQTVLVELSQTGQPLAEFIMQVDVYTEKARPFSVLNLTLQIISTNLNLCL
jgi:hypothetical protein